MPGGRDGPYGYRSVENDGVKGLAIDEEQATIVRQIFDWYTGPERLSMLKLARRLTDFGVDTPADASSHPYAKKRKRGDWGSSTVRSILNRETYTGTWYYGKSTHENREGLPSVDVPAIIDVATWDKAQERRKHNQSFGGNMKYDYLMRTRVTCGRCGAAAGARTSSSTYKGKRRVYQYYRCGAATSPDNYVHECDMPGFHADLWDAEVWSWVKGFLSDPRKLSVRVEEFRARQREHNAPLRNRLQIAEDLIKENQGK